MRLVVQRVLQAEVQVDGQSIGKIGRGFLVLVGVCLLYTSPSPRD